MAASIPCETVLLTMAGIAARFPVRGIQPELMARSLLITNDAEPPKATF
jgi:hypothetical protein